MVEAQGFKASDSFRARDKRTYSSEWEILQVAHTTNRRKRERRKKNRKKKSKQETGNRKRDLLGPGSLFSWAETERNFMGTMAVLQPNVTQPPVKIGRDAQLSVFFRFFFFFQLCCCYCCCWGGQTQNSSARTFHRRRMIHL